MLLVGGVGWALHRQAAQHARTDQESGDAVVEYTPAFLVVAAVCSLVFVIFFALSLWVALDFGTTDPRNAFGAWLASGVFFVGFLGSVFLVVESKTRILLWEHGFTRHSLISGKKTYLWSDVQKYKENQWLQYHYIYFRNGSRIGLSFHNRGLEDFFRFLVQKCGKTLEKQLRENPDATLTVSLMYILSLSNTSQYQKNFLRIYKNSKRQDIKDFAAASLEINAASIGYIYPEVRDDMPEDLRLSVEEFIRINKH